MKGQLNILFLILTLACIGCASKVPTVAQDQVQYYDKALSERMMPAMPKPKADEPASKEANTSKRGAERPEILSAYNKNAAAKLWLDSLGAKNRRLKYAAGYRVLVYAGTNRELAMKTREALVRRYSDTQFYLTYKHPSFKLVGGDFMDRLQAQAFFRALKAEFPNALIVDSEINIGD